MTGAEAGVEPSAPLLLGIRHHGPGSAKAVRGALDDRRPRVVLIEGPPEADAVVHLASDAGMRPPVALLAHAVDDPGRAAFWPMAAFSPEWVALRWAQEHGVPVRFIDLPAAHSLALGGAEPKTPSEERPPTEQPSERQPSEEPPSAAPPDGGAGAGEGGRATLRLDPLAVLAETAGYDDPERWWEDVVEHRSPAPGPSAPGSRPAADPAAAFAAVGEAMAALRAAHGTGGDERDAVREAHMRLRLREAVREFGAGTVAVVCGAWHVPALAERRPVTADRALLRGLPKVKAEITWVPWTNRRLSRATGYGAGITSPGWYGHLFTAPDRPVERWLTRVAGLLRDEDVPVSSAHVIEAVRLAGTLATVRGRPLAGLTETVDAVRAVMCEGSEVPLELIRERLIVGGDLGEVPASAPAVPLQRDLSRLQRSLRLRPEARERLLDLDLREQNGTARSRLLHRLRLLGIGWGEPAAGRGGSTGTFKEHWRLCWEPELSVRVAEAGVWGTTVESAATALAESRAAEAPGLAEVTSLAERCLLAGLDTALPTVMRVLSDRAALDADVGRLAEALPALVRAARYGDVRGTDAAALHEVAEGLAERVRVGLPPACAGLDADGAEALRAHLDAAHRAVALLDAPGLRERWRSMLRTLAGRDGVAGLLRGRCARLLLDEGALDADEAARSMDLALSPGTGSVEAAVWLEGFLSGGGLLLVHDERLLSLVDGWLARVPGREFTDVLPLLRRTFSSYEPGVRRTLGELARRGTGVRGGPEHSGAGDPGFGPGLDAGRADAVLPVLALLLGERTRNDETVGVAS
ncbi:MULTISPECIES: DUF5682 family protein [unclassified Streptomyces]|uniref:DUF5682 family protein n=1 Tax=unclassified Streptomyces TaxID=2593676 RepID=UPI0022B64432|nr:MULTISPECIES: DUF5682 family protein [unclassified Streptomyces]MCZ7417090.1 DUF5682 family protein [Streptomyces sp. WMMC897]MCZ7433082.1 DUF5682 family protein [Streptomyces sp. WMMC1477]